MRKLDIIKHWAMPLDKVCNYNVSSNGCHYYLLPSKNNLFYYSVSIIPFENPDEPIYLRDEEHIEDLILTKCTYFNVSLMDLQANLIDDVYTYSEIVSNYVWN